MGRHNDRPGSTGSSYVAILILVAVLSSVALTMLSRTGIDLAAAGERRDTIKADYLARAAVNHAMKRLFWEPGFPADESTYYMHDFGEGRYGYMVRRHTDETFATVATIAIVGKSVVEQSYVLYIDESAFEYD